jgi:twitching motility protein PilT
MMRIHGDLRRLDQYPVLEDQDTKELMYVKMTEVQVQRHQEFKELDMAYEVVGLARFRVNCFWQQHHVGAVLRMIPIRIRSIEELGLPQVLKNFADLPRGLVR